MTAFHDFIDAARAAALEVEERPGDRLRSFLESALEEAIVRHLDGPTHTTQQRRRFALPGFDPAPFGVDINWRPPDVRIGVETKVSDVLDSLSDVVKLATALAHAHFDEGYCAVAATASQWAGGGPFAAMTAAHTGRWHQWSVEDLLANPAARSAVLVATGPRPYEVPARIETLAAEPIPMPLAPTHTLRVLAVRPAAGAPKLSLPRR